MNRLLPRAEPESVLGRRLLQAGAATLSDVELLTILLDGARREAPSSVTATRLLECAGSLAAIARLGPHLLLEPGLIGSRGAARIAAALELGQRVVIELGRKDPKTVGCFEAVASWGRGRLTNLEYEEVWLLSLDGQNGLKTETRVAQGGMHGCALTPRDVLRPAVRDGASGMVLVHNHPSGDPTPSGEDVEMTHAVALAGEVVGVPLLDHVIVARGGAVSLLALGALPPA